MSKKLICLNESSYWEESYKNIWGKEKWKKNLDGPSYGEIVIAYQESESAYCLYGYDGGYKKYLFAEITDEEEAEIMRMQKRKFIDSLKEEVEKTK